LKYRVKWSNSVTQVISAPPISKKTELNFLVLYG
jgi:hypothetical protein